MSAPPVHFYIYYRIAAQHAVDARSAVAEVIRALAEQFSVSGRILYGQDDAALWMEVYENVVEPVRFEAAMNKLLAQTPFASWLAAGSTRRVERFVAAKQ